MDLQRRPWNQFPDVVILAPETDVRSHEAYAAAKTGSGEAASDLVRFFVDGLDLASVRSLARGREVTLVSAHAEEEMGRNAIPQALAAILAERLGWLVDDNVVQINIVNHTKADGFSRLARPALFAGSVTPNACCVMVDDFIGQGGTLANLRGHLIAQGVEVAGGVVLTGKPHSAKLSLSTLRLAALREHHEALEDDWQQHFGYRFDCLTESEARYLQNTQDAQLIRDRVFAPAQG